jgi:hypothetical protein
VKTSGASTSLRVNEWQRKQKQIPGGWNTLNFATEGALPFPGLGKGGGFLLFMPRELKRYYGRGDLHFISFGVRRSPPKKKENKGCAARLAFGANL